MSFYGFNGTLFLKPHQEHCPPYESAAQYGGHPQGLHLWETEWAVARAENSLRSSREISLGIIFLLMRNRYL